MKPPPTDTDGVPHHYRNLAALTGLNPSHVRTVCPAAQQQLSTTRRPWSLPPAARVLLVLIGLRTNLTTRAPTTLLATSQSTVDPTTLHPVPILACSLRPEPDDSSHSWIVDGTLIPVHDQSITAISNNYRRSINTQIIICAHRRRVVAVSPCWPGNRNDVIVARHTVAHPFDSHVILGDGRYRGIGSITTPRRDHTGRTIHDHHYRAHRRIRARVEHVLARLKDWQILRQCRRQGDAINHDLHIITGLWNLKNHTQLRVDS